MRFMPIKSFSKILCLLPDSEFAATILERAVGLAEDHQATLTVVGLIAPLPIDDLQEIGLSPEAVRSARLEAEAHRLEAVAAPWQERVHLEVRALVGRTFPDLSRLVVREGYDLLVKVPEPTTGLLARLKGSEDMHLLRKCPCAIWLLDPPAPAGYRCILAAVDVDELGSAPELAVRGELNLRIATTAATIAIAQLAELHLVNAWTKAVGEAVMHSAMIDVSEAQIRAYAQAKWARHHDAMNRLLKALEDHLGHEAMAYLQPKLHLLEGDARQVVPTLATQIAPDLTVLGTLGRTGVRGLFIGNTAESLLHQLDGSILALKPQGFVSPLDADG